MRGQKLEFCGDEFQDSLWDLAFLDLLVGDGEFPQFLFDRRQSLVVSSVVAVPFSGAFKGHQLFEGWQLSGIATVRTGSPFTVGIGFDQAGLGG